jgi:hypothetical protein
LNAKVLNEVEKLKPKLKLVLEFVFKKLVLSSDPFSRKFLNKYGSSEQNHQSKSSSNSSETSSLANWSQKRVQKWLKEAALGHLAENFKNFDGRLLNELKAMHEESPTVYYESLRRDMKIRSLEDVLLFNGALKTL